MSRADITKKVECLLEAYREALSLIPSAIYQETGYQLDQVIKGFLPGLLQMLAVLGLSAVAGAGAGAAIGFFLGGVGAFPGAVAGSQFGLDIGTFILTWMGLKFLAEAIGQGLGELVSTLENAVWRAWIAADNDRMFPSYEIDQAARGLARCVGILFRLILQGVVALILGKGGVSVGKGMASTGRSVLTKGIQGTADVTVADVVAQLRQSKLPKAFADWVEQNWEDLLRNPKLQTGKAEPVSSAAAASNAATPSQLKHEGNSKRSVDDPTFASTELPLAKTGVAKITTRVEARKSYTYTIDELNRTTKIEGKLVSNPAQGRSASAQLRAGGEYRLATDEGGHYVGHRFDGPRDDFNHFAQDMNFNRGEYKSLENTWKRAIDSGKSVSIDIQPTYPANSLRPSELDVYYTIGDMPYLKTFINRSGGH